MKLIVKDRYSVSIDDYRRKTVVSSNINFITPLASSYPDANTPLADDDKFIVRQGSEWKEVDKSELGGQSFVPQKASLLNSSTRLIKNAYTRVIFDSKAFDNNNLTITGKTGIKIKESGTYIVNGLATITELEDGKKMVVRLVINGIQKHLFGRGTSGADDLAGFGGSVMVNLDVDDVIEMYVYHNNSVDTDLYHTAYAYSYLQLFKIDNV